MDEKILSLRMERQCLIQKAEKDEYLALYRDTQPGQNEYWHGFGEPPALCRREEILEAVLAVNPGGQPKRFMGKEL